MIWLVWRRYRVLFALTAGVLAGIGIWMLMLGHALDAAKSSHACTSSTFRCPIYVGAFSLSNQAEAINLLLLAVPCVLGIVFGAPLVAGELERNTNRLVWTQGISRTKWLMVKWLSVVLSLVVLVAVLTLITQWWTGHNYERVLLNLGLNLGIGLGRLQPPYFPVTGLALGAYTVFAFAVGAALGAIIRKTSWAIVGTVVIYTTISVLMVLLVRPSLAPQLFVENPAVTASGQSEGSHAVLTHIPYDSWDLGFGYRYAPGASGEAPGTSANAAAQRCQDQNYNYSPYLACLSAHRVQMGTFYQAGNHYWELQWRESALLVGTGVILFGLTVWSVRRWRA